MKKVYVINRGPHDYSKAELVGQVVFCTSGSLDRFDISQMFREISDSMYDSSEQDFILFTSLTNACGVAAAIFAAKHQCLNLLLHTQDGEYIQRSIYLKGL